MAAQEINLARLHELQILVEPGQARRPGVTIPAQYCPCTISAALASALVQLALELRARDIPLGRLWAHQNGILEPLMHSQHLFSGMNSKTPRVQIVKYAIRQVTADYAPEHAAVMDGDVISMPAVKFWGLVVFMILCLVFSACICGQ